MWKPIRFDELPSTQTYAKNLLHSGKAKHGDVVIASHQSEGRGRFADRIWHDEPRANLLMSVILTKVPEKYREQMQFVAAFLVYQFVNTWLIEVLNDEEVNVQLKWINDVLVDNKKVSGILTESIWSGDTWKGVVIGIGVNINQELFPPEIVDRASSFANVAKRKFDLRQIEEELLYSLALMFELFEAGADIIEFVRPALEWMRTIGTFAVRDADSMLHDGLRYDGIDDDGTLRCVMSEGAIVRFQNATLILP
ncbi:MAG: biotin--[acetyl-CoA-carboxylase] ligase [bacterium]